MRATRVVGAIAIVVGLSACADKREAEDLLDQVESENYRENWARAPGWDEPLLPADGGPHGSFIDIYVNGTMEDALEGEEDITSWPDGSIVVKDGWNDEDGSSLRFVVIMEKQGSSWFFAEFDDSDDVVVAGLDDSECTGCHSGGADGILAFGFP